jgi:membrane-bound lytic murein transglycosylase B
LVAVALGLMAMPASAAPSQSPKPTPDPVPTQSLLPPSPAPDIAPALDDVALDSVEHARAAKRLDETVEARAAAIDAVERHGAELLRLTAEEARLTNAVIEATDRRRRDEQHLGRVRRRVRDLAVENYMNGGDGGDHAAVLDLDAAGANDAGREQVIVSAVHDTTIADLRDAEKALTTSRADVSRHTTARAGVRDEVVETTSALADAHRDADRLAVEVLVRLDEKLVARRSSTVRGTELPLVVLDAYYKAAQRLAGDRPECGISWWGLAGIGYIESGHGTFGGAVVLPNGDLTRPIIGIPLNGTNNTAVIGDSDGGFYDGDPSFDRAVGPMQFIPQTWESWKRDGNDDGRFDPQNIYDAAYAAAAYTCAGGPMRSDEDLRRGYFSYNHDAGYVEVVLARAKSYASAVDLPMAAPPVP